MDGTAGGVSVGSVTSRREHVFLSFAWEGFEGAWLGRHFLLRRLAERAHVLHVTLPMAADQLPRAILRGKSGTVLPRTDQVAPHLVHLRPGGVFPRFHRTRSGLQRLSNRGRMWLIEQQLKRRDWSGRRVLYVWNPDFHEMFGHADEDVSVLHCVDYYPGYFGEGTPDHARTLRNLTRCLERADLVFSTCEPLDRKLRELVERPFLRLAHGVDAEEYRAAAGGPEPPDLAAIARPRLAHVGRINPKVDTNLLADLATARPDWSVILLGPAVARLDDETRRGVERLRALPNGHVLGGRPPQELPAYYQALDVGLLAYRVHRWVPYISPLKFHEFMAAGKPAVSAPLESLREHADLLRFAEGTDAWIAAIESALADDAPERRRHRLELAAASTWQVRAQEVIERVDMAAIGPRKE